MICKRSILLLITLFAAVGFSRAQKIVVSGSYSTHIAVFDLKDSTQVWSYALPEGSECNSVDMTANGNVLFSYRAGVRMVDRAGATLWDYPVAAGSEAQTAKLINGATRVLAAICGSPAIIVELDALTGRELRRTTFDGGHKDAHAQFRQVTTSQRGGYLIPVMWADKVVEIDTTGAKIAEWDVPSSPFSVKEICCNRLLVSTKDAVIELDRSTSHADTLIYRTIGTEKLYFATEAHRLDDGVTAISNWQGYAPKGEGVSQIVWIDRHGKPFKTFTALDKIQNVSCFAIVE